MMWMMLICVIPILALLFLGGWSPRGSSWIFPVAIGVFVLAHLWMMFRGHGSHDDKSEAGNSVDENSTGDEQAGGDKGHKKGGGCCH